MRLGMLIFVGWFLESDDLFVPFFCLLYFNFIILVIIMNCYLLNKNLVIVRYFKDLRITLLFIFRKREQDQ